MSHVMTAPPGVGSSGAAHDQRSSPIPPVREVSAKFMELRKRRGLMIAVLLLTLGLTIVLNAIFLILHGVDAHTYGPAGGLKKFRGLSLAFVDLFGISAVLVGAAAGSTDLSAGMFRHLVITGRSRVALFFSWLSAGLMLILPITAFTFAIEAVIGVYAAPTGTVSSIVIGGTGGGAPFHVATQSAVPSTDLLVLTGLWLMLQVVIAYVLGLGLGALTGSRSVTCVILIAMQLVLTPLLSGLTIPHLINAQRCFIGVAIAQLEPSGLVGFSGAGNSGGSGAGNILSIAPMPTFALALVIPAWFLVALILGARRTARRDV
jgi:uncharacterized membrane protein